MAEPQSWKSRILDPNTTAGTPRLGAPAGGPLFEMWRKAKEVTGGVVSSLAEQPVAKVIGWLGELADEGFRGNTREDPNWKVAGVPFGPKQVVYHGTKAPFNQLNPGYNNPDDLFGWMTHFAEDPKYAGVYAPSGPGNYGEAVSWLKSNYQNSARTRELYDHYLRKKATQAGLTTNFSAWFPRWLEAVQKEAALTGKLDPSRIIPAKLDVKNALDLATWPPSQGQFDDLEKLGASTARTLRWSSHSTHCWPRMKAAFKYHWPS